jgi:prefoldin subunit 5
VIAQEDDDEIIVAIGLDVEIKASSEYSIER